MEWHLLQVGISVRVSANPVGWLLTICVLGASPVLCLFGLFPVFLLVFVSLPMDQEKEGFPPIKNLGYLPNKCWPGLGWFLELFSHTSRER